jgi:hypothetical protein
VGGYRDRSESPRETLIERPHFWDFQSARFKTASLRHTLFHQNIDFRGDCRVDGNLGPGVFDSDDQAEGDGL